MTSICLHPSAQLAVLAASILFSYTPITAQDDATSEVIESLRTGSAQSIASTIASLPDDALNQNDVVGQLTLLLHGERSVVQHLMGRETVGDRAWFRMFDLPSASVATIMQQIPNLESERSQGLAFEVIARIGKPNHRAYSLLLPYCSDEDVYLRSRAIAALSAVADDSDESVQQFGKLLTDSDPVVQWTVLDALDDRHDHIASVIPGIIKLLDDESDVYIAVSNHFSLPEKLRGRAARLLAKIGPDASDAIPKLKTLTGSDFNKNVRIAERRYRDCMFISFVEDSSNAVLWVRNPEKGFFEA